MSTESTILQLRRGTLDELNSLNTMGLVNNNEIMHVTDTNELYIGKEGTKLYEKITKGGVLWSKDKEYLKGDIVVFQENSQKSIMVAYRAVQDNNNQLPYTIVSGAIVHNRSFWLTVYPETTNIKWHPDLIYTAGDIVEHGTDLFIVPIGTTHGTIPAGAMPPSSHWVLMNPDEVGGIAYNALSAYAVGDEVTINGLTYIAILENGVDIHSSPVGAGVVSPADRTDLVTRTTWKLDNDVPIYEDAVDYYPGDIVYDPLDGFDYILPPGEVHTTGNTAPGIPWEKISTDKERGGVAWSEFIDYTEGDESIEDGVSYIAVTGLLGNINISPRTVVGTPDAKWKLDDGIQIWNPLNEPYLEGDIVYDPQAGTNWIVPPGGNPTSGIPPHLDAPQWAEVLSDEERGGVAYLPNSNYNQGDLVVFDSSGAGTDWQMYYAIADDYASASTPDQSTKWERFEKIPAGANDGEMIVWDDTLKQWVTKTDINYNKTIQTDGQLTVVVSGTFDPVLPGTTLPQVFINGSLQRYPEQYTLSGTVGSTTVTFLTPLNLDDWVNVKALG